MSLDGTKIVAIDDTPSIRTFLRVSLEDEGAEFHEASTALEGLELCKKVYPDLVVLDLGLPDIDGLEILPEIKKIQPDNKLPVLVLSVRKARETIKEAFDKGASGYLTKPFVVEDLLEIIEEKLPCR
ncbi:response regulator [uncultured Kiloniella sp.]|uniref:response regulator n=1 Tax=Kiloniella sp. TaxID=1938587 RepID=UPI002609B2A1|nr:response regulator [uncultured Kiloniella sp.]